MVHPVSHAVHGKQSRAPSNQVALVPGGRLKLMDVMVPSWSELEKLQAQKQMHAEVMAQQYWECLGLRMPSFDVCKGSERKLCCTCRRVESIGCRLWASILWILKILHDPRYLIPWEVWYCSIGSCRILSIHRSSISSKAEARSLETE